MHITPDISIGSLVTIGFTLLGVFVTIGRLSQLLTTLVSDVDVLKQSHSDHIKEDLARFDWLEDHIKGLDRGVDPSAIAAAISTAVSAVQLAQRGS